MVLVDRNHGQPVCNGGLLDLLASRIADSVNGATPICSLRARNKPRSFTRLQTRGQLAKGFALDIPSKTRTKFSFRGVQGN